MNSYERVIAAIELKEPDRVPVMELVVDPKVWRALSPDAADMTDFIDKIDLDGVGCGPCFQKTWKDDTTFVDEWGVEYRTGPELFSHPVKGPITSIEDLRAYNPPDPEAPHRLGELPDLVRKFKGKRVVLFHHRAAFMWAAYLMGMDILLMNFLTDAKLVHAVMEMVTEVNEIIIRRAVRAGADIISLGDDYASNIGPLMSPALFKEFIFPRLERIVNAIHEEGAFCLKHSDGNIWPLLDMIVDTGIDIINPIEPVAGMDIGEVKKKYGRRVCLMGNIDCGELLSSGSVEQVEAAVRECILKASSGGGHILCSSNSIHSSVKPENFMAMIKAARKYGKYPLNINKE